jgi:hypothetical protein
MGRRCIKKDADEDIQRDEEALCTKKRLQKVHFSSHSPRWTVVICTEHVACGLAMVVVFSL